MIMRSVKIGREHIGYLKWLLESHDGMATPTTRDGSDDVVDLMVAPDFVEELDELLDAVSLEIGLIRVPEPLKSPL
jgi:hypothetical protein